MELPLTFFGENLHSRFFFFNDERTDSYELSRMCGCSQGLQDRVKCVNCPGWIDVEQKGDAMRMHSMAKRDSILYNLAKTTMLSQKVLCDIASGKGHALVFSRLLKPVTLKCMIFHSESCVSTIAYFAYTPHLIIWWHVHCELHVWKILRSNQKQFMPW